MNNLRMRTKLSLGFGIMLLLTCLIGGLSIYKMRGFREGASFAKEALMPQLKAAIVIDQRMRDAGLSMRRFVDNANPADAQKAVADLDAIKQEIQKTRALATIPGLTELQTFLAAMPSALANFEASCNTIRAAQATTSQATGVVDKEGPVTINILNELIDQTHADIMAAAQAGDMPRVERLFSYLNRYNELFDEVENLRRSIFIALSRDDANLLQKTVQGFAEPKNSFAKLYAELQGIPAVEDKIRRAMLAFDNLERASASLLSAMEQMEKAERELVRSYSSALEQVDVLVSHSVEHNDTIAGSVAAQSSDVVNTLLVALLVVLLVGLTLTISLTLGITKPLSRFVSAAKLLSDGKFDTRVDIDSKDEIGATAHDINKAFDVVVDKMLWYEAMLDAIPSPITVTDMNRNWTFINKATEKILGRSRASVLGHSCREWGNPMCGTEKCPIERLKYGESHHKLRQDNAEFSIIASHITNSRGEKIGHIELLTDVTELILAQQRAESALSEGMHQAVGQLEGVMDQVGCVIEEISQRITNAEHGAVDQASQLMENATAMNQMNSTVTEVARNATAAAEVSAVTRSKAEEGASSVHQAVDGIRNVRDESLVLKNDMAVLSEHAQNISRIMGVISDIADQTNLLALNAAIEAARAGEAGRGFAVVADEVRKLAEKTMASTMDVSNAIQSIQQSAQKSTHQVDLAVAGIENVTLLAERSGEALSEIVHMVDQAADQVRAIASASEEQSSSSEEINRSIAQVNEIAADTASTMRDASKSLDSLLHLAHKVNVIMNEMRNK